MDNEVTSLKHLEYLEELLAAEKDRTKQIQIDKEEFFNNSYSQEKLTKRLSLFFKEKDLAIVELTSGERSKEYYDVAKKIWNERELLIPFIRLIPRYFKTREFDYNTSDFSQLECNKLYNFCTFIKEQRDWFKFKVSKNNLHIELGTSKGMRKFFHGFWAELVALYLIDKSLQSFTAENKVTKKIFSNIKVKYFNSDNQTISNSI